MENFIKMMSQMQNIQEKVREMQQRLAQIQATGEAGAGAVKATVDGHKKIIKLDIDKSFMHPEEKEMVQDLIIAAITLATQAVADKVKEELKKNTLGVFDELPIDLML
jgi:nucleoid-associated protein EbfC